MSWQFGILIFPQVQQLDLTGPYEVFASLPGAEVHLLWKQCGAIRSATGLELNATRRFADCPPLDVICVPGGDGINALMEDAEVLDFLRRQARACRYVTSVCTGSLLLGAAGLLEGKRATAHWASRDLLDCFGAVPTNGRVVRDGNLITAGGITAGIDFGLTVVAELAGPAHAQAIQLQLEYAPDPPFDAGTPETAPADIVEAVRRGGSATRQAREAIIARIRG